MRRFVAIVCLVFALDAYAKKGPDYLAVHQQVSTAPAAPHAVAAPASAEPLPWAVGQWIALKETDASGNVSYRRTSIVAHDDCGWWLEAVTTTAGSGEILKLCYSVPAWPRPDTTERIVQVVKTKEHFDKPTVLDLRTPKGAEIADQIGHYFAGAFQPLTYDDTTAPTAITVASGSFDGCRKVVVEARAGETIISGSAWVHSSVPVFGLVQGEAGGVVTEIVDYGLTGATSLLK